MQFDRFDICSAYYMYATLWNCSSDNVQAIWRRLERIDYKPSHSEEKLEGLSENAQEILVSVVRRLEGDEPADKLRRELFPQHSDVTLALENSDDDPTRITAYAYYEFAEKWCDAVGSAQGSTWETDGSDFLYDIWTWHPKLIEELEADGFKLDLSQYSDCDDETIAIATHASECDECQGSYSDAEDHIKGEHV